MTKDEFYALFEENIQPYDSLIMTSVKALRKITSGKSLTSEQLRQIAQTAVDELISTTEKRLEERKQK